MMEHFSVEKWIDFANQGRRQQREGNGLEQHLRLGCKSCQKTVLALAASSGVSGRGRELPASGKRRQNCQSGIRWCCPRFSEKKGADSRIKVLFDSFLQPILEGVRSAGTGTRQMLYRADPYQIDVQLEMKPSGNRIVVTGQLLNLSNPKIIAVGTRVLVSNMHGDVVHTVANEFGEFSGEVKNSGDLQLTFATPSGEPIVISLREALGRLPEEKA